MTRASVEGRRPSAGRGRLNPRSLAGGIALLAAIVALAASPSPARARPAPHGGSPGRRRGARPARPRIRSRARRVAAASRRHGGRAPSSDLGPPAGGHPAPAAGPRTPRARPAGRGRPGASRARRSRGPGRPAGVAMVARDDPRSEAHPARAGRAGHGRRHGHRRVPPGVRGPPEHDPAESANGHGPPRRLPRHRRELADRCTRGRHGRGLSRGRSARMGSHRDGRDRIVHQRLQRRDQRVDIARRRQHAGHAILDHEFGGTCARCHQRRA